MFLTRKRRPGASHPDCARQRVDIVGAVMAAAVHKERRGAGNTAQGPPVDRPPPPNGTGMAGEVLSESVQVESELVRISDKVRRAQRVLVIEEAIVHLPECALP